MRTSGNRATGRPELIEDAITSISQRETPGGARSAGHIQPVRFALSSRSGRLTGVPHGALPFMTFSNIGVWQIAGGLACGVILAALAAWLLLLRKRPTPEEEEKARRLFLVKSGRLVDGMSLDVCEVQAEDGRTLTMLLYSYRIGGVDYECSQDLTDIRDVVDTGKVSAGFPCTVRYQPGNPQNSIAVAETWTGLRDGLPVLPDFDDPEPIDMSHLRPDRE